MQGVIVGAFVLLVVGAVIAVRIIRPYQVAVVERVGRYDRTMSSGLHFIFPVLERIIFVDMREQVADVAPQDVITKDNVVVTVDAVIYFQVTDAKMRLYNVANFAFAIVTLAQTSLRNIIGELTLDEALTSRETINAKLRHILDEATDRWGTKVTRVELKRIDPPGDVTSAMHRQMKAEREKRALILESEGQRQSAILKAEGAKQAAILEAEGRAEAIRRVADADKYQKMTVAEGEKQAIINVFTGYHEGKPTREIITLKYLELLPMLTKGEATKIFLPYEASGILASLGVVRELFQAESRKTSPPPT
jgi:regulator of protease activity HflC (stomatin/prohibitin superfamily)